MADEKVVQVLCMAYPSHTELIILTNHGNLFSKSAQEPWVRIPLPPVSVDAWAVGNFTTEAETKAAEEARVKAQEEEWSKRNQPKRASDY